MQSYLIFRSSLWSHILCLLNSKTTAPIICGIQVCLLLSKEKLTVYLSKICLIVCHFRKGRVCSLMVVDIVCLFKVKHSMDWLVMIIDNFVSYTSYVYKSMTILLVTPHMCTNQFTTYPTCHKFKKSIERIVSPVLWTWLRRLPSVDSWQFC